MSTFSIQWLDLREPADLAARDKTLLQQAINALAQRNDPISPDRLFVDLGSGTGSTLRAFLQQGAANIVWRLVDLNGDLLDEALRRHGKQVLIEDYQADLTLVPELPLSGANMVTASALFDLASAEFCDALIARLNPRKTIFYAALNYDGVMRWNPVHPLDEVVLAAFNRDQERDKGFGPALGPRATEYLRNALEKVGYQVHIAPSPWRLAAGSEPLAQELVNGIAQAVATDYGIDPQALAQWQHFRLAQLGSANSSCEIGHWDLLALPKTNS